MFFILDWAVDHTVVKGVAGDHFYIGALLENSNRKVRKQKGNLFDSLLEKGTSGVQKISQYLPLHVCVAFLHDFFFARNHVSLTTWRGVKWQNRI